MLEKLFKLKEKKTNVKTEIIAGITTFLAMSYILLANPATLSLLGTDMYLGDSIYSSIFVATAISAVIATLIMGLYANYPVALAPGMGVNAFFSYTVMLSMGYSFSAALGAVLVSGVIFCLISLTKAREIIINAIPMSLKYAIGGGIGFFIGFIGLANAKLIVPHPATMVGLGELNNPNTMLALFGIIVTIILLAKKVKAAVFYGMLVTAIVGFITGLIPLPTAILSMPPSVQPTLGLAFKGTQELFALPIMSIVTVIFSFLFVDFFDTAGTLMAVGSQAGMINEEGQLVDSEKALLSDAVGTVAGAVLGTSTVTSFVESMTGVEVGGRTGLTAVSTAFMFVLSLFFWPVLSVLAATPAITAPALVAVGALMASALGSVEWDKFEYSVSTFFAITFMILAYSIAQGISIAFIMYTIIMVVTKRAKEVHPTMYILVVIFLINYAIPYIS